MSLGITVIILTFNEEIHIRRCIENARRFADQIFVVDSFSTDSTIEIAKELNVDVFQNKWTNNYAKQFNWALNNLPIKTEWVFRLDADEYLSSELINELQEKLPSIDNGVSGIAFPLTRVFMNKEIKKGILKLLLLRLFRFGHGYCEQKWMDEHIYLSKGQSVTFEYDFSDHNLNNLGWWTQKHNGYSIREAVDLLNMEFDLLPKKVSGPSNLVAHAANRRSNKNKYAQLPLFWRAFFLFVYRYIFKGGFLDGKEAFLWHFLQGLWYRTLVDAKIYEIKKECGTDKDKMIVYLKEKYNIDCLQG